MPITAEISICDVWKDSVKSPTESRRILHWRRKEIDGTQLVIEDWNFRDWWDGFEIQGDGKVLEVFHIHCKIDQRIEAHCSGRSVWVPYSEELQSFLRTQKFAPVSACNWLQNGS